MYSIFWWGWVVKTEHTKLSQLSSSSKNPMKSRWYARVEEASNFESEGLKTHAQLLKAIGCINLDYASDDRYFQWVPDVLTTQEPLHAIMFSQPVGTCSPLVSKMGIRTTKEFGLSYFVCNKVSLMKKLRLRAVRVLFFFAKLLHAKPQHARGEAARGDKRGLMEGLFTTKESTVRLFSSGPNPLL